MRSILITCLMCFTCIGAFSQLSIRADVSQDFYVEYKFQDRFSFGLGFMSGELDAGNLKPTFKADLIKEEDMDFFLGIGLAGLDPVDVVSIPLGVDVFPFENKHFGFVLGMENLIGDEYHIQGSLGLKFRFK